MAVWPHIDSLSVCLSLSLFSLDTPQPPYNLFSLCFSHSSPLRSHFLVRWYYYLLPYFTHTSFRSATNNEYLLLLLLIVLQNLRHLTHILLFVLKAQKLVSHIREHHRRDGFGEWMNFDDSLGGLRWFRPPFCNNTSIYFRIVVDITNLTYSSRRRRRRIVVAWRATTQCSISISLRRSSQPFIIWTTHRTVIVMAMVKFMKNHSSIDSRDMGAPVRRAVNTAPTRISDGIKRCVAMAHRSSAVDVAVIGRWSVWRIRMTCWQVVASWTENDGRSTGAYAAANLVIIIIVRDNRTLSIAARQISRYVRRTGRNRTNGCSRRTSCVYR